jgi:hypothetical protein
MPPDEGYAVVLREPAGVPVAQAAEAAAPALGVHPSDMARRLTSQQGWVAGGLSREVAEAVRAALVRAGAAAEALREADLIELPPARQVATLNFRDGDDLVVAEADGACVRVAFAAVVALLVGRMAPPTARRRELSEVLPPIGRRVMGMLMRGQREADRVPELGRVAEPALLLHMASQPAPDAPLLHLGLRADRLSYACLGDDAGPLVSADFHRLVAELLARMPCAWTNVAPRMLERPMLFPWPTYASASELRRDLSRVVQLAVLDRC